MNVPGPIRSGISNGEMQSSPAMILFRAWQEGQNPALETFVAGLPAVSPAELATMIRFDLAARWNRNDRRRSEEYFGLFSSVAADAELAIDIIYAEYLAREKSGEQPLLTEYQERFPAFADVLVKQIGLHQAIDALDDAQETEPTEPNQFDEYAAELDHESPEGDASYEILEQIGSGGMGVVYKARQPILNRLVALKMVRTIDADNPEILARFRGEARVVAALHHPHIVQVFDYGQHNGLPYITMELITKGSLADRLDGTPWDPRSAASLVAKLAAAVQCAHEHHVIHRDLKPANVLVVNDDGELEVKVTDFGLARFLVDDSLPHTKSITFLGTPSYMAPEQAGGRSRDVGPAADIYSLGAILCELLTGEPPIRGESPIETLRLLLSTEPGSIHRFGRRLPYDLATICDKCLQRDPTKRYASAADLLADLNRFLEGRPIQARPVGKVERTWRWCRRNRLLAVALGCVAIMMGVLVAVAAWHSVVFNRELAKTRTAEQAEREASQIAQQRLWNVYLNEAKARSASRQVGQRFAALESVDKAADVLRTIGPSDEQQRELRNAVLAAVALPDIRRIRLVDKVPGIVSGCDMSVAADCYVVATIDGTCTGRRLTDNRLLWEIAHAVPQARIVQSRDGRIVVEVGPHTTKVWRVDGPQPRLAWEVPKAQYFTLAPDGEHACYSDPVTGMRLVRMSDGVAVRTIGKSTAHSRFAFHAGTKRIAVRGADGVQVINATTGAVEFEFPAGNIAEPLLDWHPSGQFLAVWDSEDGIAMWNVNTRTKMFTFPNAGTPAELRFNRDGSMLVSLSLWNQRMCVWDAGNGHRLLELPEFHCHADEVGPRNEFLFLTRRGADLELTELTLGTCRTLAQSLFPALGFWHHASVSPEGRIVALSSFRGFELWDLQTAQRLYAHAIGPCVANFDIQGRLTIASHSGLYRFLAQAKVGDQFSTTEPPANGFPRRTAVHFKYSDRLTGEIADPTCMAVNASGESLVFQDQLGWAIKQFGTDAGVSRLATKGDPRTSAMSDNNRFAAVVSWEKPGATVWDAKSGALLADLAIGKHGVVQFSPDSQILAASPDGVTLWNTSDWRRTVQLRAQGTTPTGLGMAFSPDSRVLGVGEINGVLRLVDPFTGDEWARLTHDDFSVATTIAFSPNQGSIIASSIDKHSAALIWDLMAMRRELALRRIDLPADILKAKSDSTNSKFSEGQLDVVFDDIDVIH
jgi:serine/threonine-protein kinase